MVYIEYVNETRTTSTEIKMKNKFKVEYTSNNSGGRWRLTDQNWKDLEAAGWEVQWEKESWLDALATTATIVIEAADGCKATEKATAMFEDITGADTDAKGCQCCGRPHSFYAKQL